MRLDPARVPLPNRSRRGFRARGLLAAASGLGLLAAAAGCGGSGSAGGMVPGTVTIAAEPGVDDASLYLAEKDGLFAAQGLTHVIIKQYPNQAAELTALKTGQADIAASDYGNILYTQAEAQAQLKTQAHSKPDELRILADGYHGTQGVLEVLTWSGSKITKPGDLTGVTIGVPSDGVIPKLRNSGHPSLAAAAAADVLSEYVGKAAESLNWHPMPQWQEVSELTQHKIQAILVSQPYIYEAESQAGAVEVLDACSGATAGLPLLGYVAMSGWVRDNPAAVADFQAALAQAQSRASVTGQVQSLLPGTTHMTAADANLITIGSYPTSTSALSVEEAEQVMINFQMIKGTSAPAVPPMIVSAKH